MDTTEKTTGESVWLKTGTKKVVGLKWGPSPLPFLIIGSTIAMQIKNKQSKICKDLLPFKYATHSQKRMTT
jgi:hypothetical protein